MDEKEIGLEMLKGILEEDFPVTYFKVGGYKDDAICIRKAEDGMWHVFTGFRNKEQGLSLHQNFIEGAEDMIKRLYRDDVQAAIIINKLRSEIRA